MALAEGFPSCPKPVALTSVVPRLYSFLFLSVLELEMMGGTKEGHDGRHRERKRKACVVCEVA